ncbi:DUF2723 domain-containing protein [Larkinella harenae]
MQSFKRLNTLTGWLVFLAALITYTLTVERTASFWDCSEFIACAFKLQVPHAPGAPFFLLLGRLFSLLALDNLTQVAYWINMISVLASAFTILFLFWTITMLAQKLVGKPAENRHRLADTVLILGTGAVGALVYTFSDTFWFSAVEAEVYGLSSFFTAIVVWAAFRWERMDDEATANRWLLLMAYLVGLSIGVHLLSMVVLPALALVYYFKKFPTPTLLGGLVALIAGVGILGVINVGLIQGLPGMAFVVERFFVNTLGLPFNSGMIFFFVLLIGCVAYGIFWSARQQRPALNTALLALTFLLIGYASYTQVLIRANFNPPVNVNNPDDALNILSYLRREQYASRSLLHGPVFTARPIDQKRGAPIWKKNKDHYVISDYRPEYVYAPGDEIFFPRVYSSDLNHPQLYRQMLGLSEGQKPTQIDNLRFLFQHQLGHMWWRYLMWNFAGRQSDEEGAGYLLPWSSNQHLPELLTTNKARDNFYLLPFVLGLFGIVFQYYRRRRDWLVMGMLFLFTGILLQVYLNSPPSEPRERDYIYVGSFYFFAIWVGLGAMALAEGVRTVLKAAPVRNGLAVGLCLLIPGMMGLKSWDNHNRNNRYYSVDFAKNLLNSCAQDAILFTGADIDTYPLWYVQEVEGFRRDVRVCNLSLLNAEWYIQQMKRKTYESDALPISLEFDQFDKGKNEFIPFYEVPAVKNGIDLKQYIHLVKTSNPAIQLPLTNGDKTNILPSSTVFLPVDRAAVERADFVPKPLKPLLKDTLQWNIGSRDLSKSDLIMLDIIATNNWQRPIYFSSTMGTESYLNLKTHMQVEGMVYRLMPVAIPGAEDGYVNSERMYDNMLRKSTWRQLDNPDVYYDETYRSSPIVTARLAFLRLADQFIQEQNPLKAREVLDDSLKAIPDKVIPYDAVCSNYVRLYFNVGAPQKALKIANTMAVRADQNLHYARTTRERFGNPQADRYILQVLMEACQQAGQPAAARRYEAILQKHASLFG